MVTYEAPEFWRDARWLESRHELLEAFAHEGGVAISFRYCRWLDLQPLVDTLIHVAKHTGAGHHVHILLDEEHSEQDVRRTILFLRDTGFLDALITLPRSDLVLVDNGRSVTDPQAFLARLQGWTRAMLLLDYETLVPCHLLDVSTLKTRQDVFHYCRQLKHDSLTGRAKAVRMEPALIYETKVFFDGVLPELIDNTRIHKLKGQPLCALYLRLRRREERRLRPRTPGSHLAIASTMLDRRTPHQWHDDLVEAAYADTGVGIQDTWVDGWKRRHSPTAKRIPKLKRPTGYVRVDGPNGAVEILKDVFEKNSSSLLPEQRIAHGLPTNLTGLHSIRQSIRGSDWAFSVRSGSNYITVASTSADLRGEDVSPQLTAAGRGRFPATSGVQFLFRFSATQVRPTRDWTNVVSTTLSRTSPSWWITTYPIRFDQAHVVDGWELPSEASNGDVVLLRPGHVRGKSEVLALLREAGERHVRIVFCELAQPTALRISLLLDDLLRYEGESLEEYRDAPFVCPVMTNTMYVRVPGPDGAALTRSFIRGHEMARAWWTLPNAPIRSPQEVFARCRQVDSRTFWNWIRSDAGTFLEEPVKWSDGIRLQAGYLSFVSAMRHRTIRKLLRKRLVVLLHALRVGRVVPTSSQTRHVANLIARDTVIDPEHSDRVGVLAGVVVPRSDVERPRPPDADTLGEPVLVPTFVYPWRFIEGHRLSSAKIPTTRGDDHPVRGMDWLENPDVPKSPPRYSRVGRTGRIRIVSDEVISVAALQGPPRAYEVWQQHDLLRIGHISHDRHHFYLWLDLVAFLNSRTPDAHEMVSQLARKIAELRPHAIFYRPTEATEVLVDRLVEFSHDDPLDGFPIDRLWPLTSVVDFSNLRTGSVNTVLGAARPPDAHSVAVFLDDVVVTGATVRLAQSHLRQLGYSTVHVLTLVDRSEVDSVPRAEGTFHAYWSLHVTSMGPVYACAICRGVESLRLLAAQTLSTVVRDVLLDWIAAWETDRHGLRHEKTIAEVPIQIATLKRLASSTPNLRLYTSGGLFTWGIEVIARLRHFGFLFERVRPDLNPVMTELLCALVFMYWYELTTAQQRDLLRGLAERLLTDSRQTGRELVVIAFASLSRTDAAMAVEILEDTIARHGVTDLSTAVTYFAALHLAEPRPDRRATRMAHVRQELNKARQRQIELERRSERLPIDEAFAQQELVRDNAELEFDRGYALFSLFAAKERGAPPYRLAVRTSGFRHGSPPPVSARRVPRDREDAGSDCAPLLDRSCDRGAPRARPSDH